MAKLMENVKNIMKINNSNSMDLSKITKETVKLKSSIKMAHSLLRASTRTAKGHQAFNI